MERIIPRGQGSYKVGAVDRKYAFEVPDVPRHEAKYLLLKYSFRFPPLPTDLSGTTFSR
jgi:DNA polymerase alpha subunit A